MTGKIGREKDYNKLKKSGQLITDPSSFDFDDELNKSDKKPKEQFYDMLNHNGCQVKMSAKNGDKFIIEFLVSVKEGWELPKEILDNRKVYCYQCLEIHTIGEFIVFPGWDSIIYFNTNTKKIIEETIR